MCNTAPGVVVPIPTLTLDVAPLTPSILPKTIELLAPTSANAPRAVEFIKLLLATSEPIPIPTF